MSRSKSFLTATLVTAFVILSAALALAAEPPLMNKLADARQYFAICEDVKADGVVREVIDWRYSTTAASVSHGVVLKVSGKDGDFMVYMGPSQYLGNMGYKFEVGEKIGLKGILASVDGNVMMLARSYTSGGTAFILRDPEGTLASR